MDFFVAQVPQKVFLNAPYVAWHRLLKRFTALGSDRRIYDPPVLQRMFSHNETLFFHAFDQPSQTTPAHQEY